MQQVPLGIPLLEVFVIIKAAVVGGDAVEVAEIDRAGAFFIGQQRFVHLFAVADSDDPDVLLLPAEQFAHRLRLRLDRARRRFLHENVPARAVFEREQHQVDRFVQGHDEAGHARFGDGDRVAVFDLVDPQRNDAPARTHDVAVAGAADFRRLRRARFRHDHFLHHRLGGAHGIDGIRGFVRGQADDRLDAFVDRRRQYVVRADDIRANGFHGEELAGRHLFECCRVEDIIHAVHRVFDGCEVPHVADVELDFLCDFGHFRLKLVPHIVLLLLVAGKDPDFTDIRFQKTVQHRISETPRPACDH